MILNETPRRIMVTKLVAWGHWFALTNIIIAIIIAAIYVFATPLPETVLGHIFLMVNWLSHIGFLTFFGFVIFVLPLIYIVPKSRFIRGAGSTIAALGLALLAFDALLYTKYGLHLSFGSADLLKNEAQNVMETLGWQQWGFFLLLFVVWLSFQLILANALWKRIERFQKFRLGMPIGSVFVACFVSSHALHVWADANLYQPIIKQDNLFPLSYPATAKTLMSRYGLLDLESYQQRKALQFDSGLSGISYPTSPIYCSINNNEQMVLLINTDENPVARAGLFSYSEHYDLSASADSAKIAALFGLPEIYHQALQQHTPLLLELPAQLGLQVQLFSEQEIPHERINGIRTEDFAAFNQFVLSAQPKLAIGFMSSDKINTLLQSGLLQSNKVIVSQLAGERGDIKAVQLLSNFNLTEEVSSHLDFAPTVLAELGCQTSADTYSLGQPLQTPLRNWLVGTKGSKVIVMQSEVRIELMSNGTYKIFDRRNGEESTDSLNTSLVSQAMKHLTRFKE